MNKYFIVALIGVVMTVGLVLAGCNVEEECIGTGDCTVTIKQGTSGLYVDYDSPRSSCGSKKKWSDSYNSYRGGCNVQNIMDSGYGKYGPHSCDCGN
jgi:hypothetical protein